LENNKKSILYINQKIKKMKAPSPFNDVQSIIDELLMNQKLKSIIEYHRASYDAMIEMVGTDPEKHSIYRDLEYFFESLKSFRKGK